MTILAALPGMMRSLLVDGGLAKSGNSNRIVNLVGYQLRFFGLVSGMTEFMERRGYASLDDFRGVRRDRVVPHSQIKRPEQTEYRGGYAEDDHEGYALPERPITTA
jgi:hypothetical protein